MQQVVFVNVDLNLRSNEGKWNIGFHLRMVWSNLVRPKADTQKYRIVLRLFLVLVL
jgi:hypothetical protein